MSRLLVLSLLLGWAGATLVLADLRWFRRPSLTDRLRPFEPGGLAAGRSGGGFSVQTFIDVVGPLARSGGERLARAFGVTEDLRTRLDRVHSPLDPTAFRLRQSAWVGAGLAAGTAAAASLRPAVPLLVLLLLGSPTLGFLWIEQQLASASDRHKRRLLHELPVVAEQLGLLLSAGYSLGSALNRLAERGTGACGRDLRRVTARIRQGLGEVDALREWAVTADVDAVTRLVAVLALNGAAADLGRLISEEARAIRRDVQRELVEQIERRSQQVWIVITVAALVPGSVFIAVPFIDALRAFGR